jgi:serine/threonine-protein kinase SRPK3
MPNHYTWDPKGDDFAYTIFSLANFAHGNACLFYWFYDLIAHRSSLARQTTTTTLDTPKNIQPPEALTGGKIGHTSDVWALGCTVSLILILTLLFFGTHAHR